jgi:hypothetical protein
VPGYFRGVLTVAKKQQDSASTKTPRTKTAKDSKADNGVASAAKAASSAPAPSREISNEAIGAAAGGIWSVLNSQGPQTLASLKKAVDTPEELIHSGIGWLAREDKLSFELNGRALKISLRD